MSNEIKSPWLSPPEAAVYLGLTVKALYQAVRRGTVVGHRLGNKLLRFHRDELDKALLANPTTRVEE